MKYKVCLLVDAQNKQVDKGGMVTTFLKKIPCLRYESCNIHYVMRNAVLSRAQRAHSAAVNNDWFYANNQLSTHANLQRGVA